MLNAEEEALDSVGDWAALGAELAKNETVTSLDLRGCKLSESGALQLADALKVNGKLEVLNLEGNEIRDAGASHLFSALEVNTTLKFLNLTGNLFGEAAIETLASALEKNSGLRSIDLQGNPLTEVDIQIWFKLSTAVERNRSLHFLHTDDMEDRAAPLALVARFTKRNRQEARSAAGERLIQIKAAQTMRETGMTDEQKSRASMRDFFESKDESKEVAELKKMIEAGAPSFRGGSSALPEAVGFVGSAKPTDDYMSAHVRRYRTDGASGDVKPWEMRVETSRPRGIGTDSYMMSHVKQVNELAPQRSKPQASPPDFPQPSLISTDSYMTKHARAAREIGPGLVNNTKMTGVAPTGDVAGSFMMLHVQQVITDKKRSGTTPYDLVPHVQPGSVHMEFVKKYESGRDVGGRQRGETMVGVAPKLTARSYMNQHTRKLEQEKVEVREIRSSIGMAASLPPETYMHTHIKKVSKVSKKTPKSPPASVPADSFMNSWVASKKKFEREVKQKEREQAPKATQLPVDNFLDSHLQKVRETNAKRPEGSVGGQQVGAKPNFGLDEFTLAAHTKAQKEVSSSVQGGTIYF